MRIPRSFPVAVLAFAILFPPLPGHSQSVCNAVSNNPLVMANLCSSAPPRETAPASAMNGPVTPSPLTLTVQQINSLVLRNAPPIQAGDNLLMEANRGDFDLALLLSDGNAIATGPHATTTETAWRGGRMKLDYPGAINKRVVGMRVRLLHDGGTPLLFRGIKFERQGRVILALDNRPSAPEQAAGVIEPPMSYPPDPMTPNPHIANVSVSRADLLGHQPQTGFLAPRLPSYSMSPMMFQSTTTSTGDPNHYKFQGKELDAETGLYNFGARYYSPALGRYMSPDWSAKPTPVPYANISDPQTLNLYSFGRNNPLSIRDPDGHDPGDKFKSKAAAAADAVKYIRKQENGYKFEYGTRIEKDGKSYSYSEPVTQGKPGGVDLQPLQKNDVGDVHTHNYGVDDAHANSIERPDKINTIQDKDSLQKLQDNPSNKVDYQSFVGAPNGDLLQFTPNSNAPDLLGDTKVVQHNVAPDPNSPSRSQPQQPQPQPKKDKEQQ